MVLTREIHLHVLYNIVDITPKTLVRNFFKDDRDNSVIPYIMRMQMRKLLRI